jgi:hypothetical protein
LQLVIAPHVIEMLKLLWQVNFFKTSLDLLQKISCSMHVIFATCQSCTCYFNSLVISLWVKPKSVLIQQFLMCNEQCAMWNHVRHGYNRHLCCWKVGGVDGPPTCENVTTNNSTINSAPRNQKFIGKWNITTYSYKSSSCTFETTPLKPFARVFMLWMMICIWILKFCKCCDVLLIYRKKCQIIFYFEKRLDKT